VRECSIDVGRAKARAGKPPVATQNANIRSKILHVFPRVHLAANYSALHTERVMKLRIARLSLPMLAKELVEMAQRRRTYGIRVAFAALLFSVSALVSLPSYRAARLSPRGLLGRGAQLLDVLYVVEWVGLCLFVPAVVSGDGISSRLHFTVLLGVLRHIGRGLCPVVRDDGRFVCSSLFFGRELRGHRDGMAKGIRRAPGRLPLPRPAALAARSADGDDRNTRF
jgi:hypothetical protein